MTRRPALRASDLDRELVAVRLRDATAEGRIGTEELEQRLGAALAARTYRQLSAVVSDLPVAEGEPARMPVWATASLGLAGAVGLLAAAATAAALFAGIAGVSLTWTFLGRVFFGRRGPQARRPGAAQLAPAATAQRTDRPQLERRRPLATRRQLAARRQLAVRSVRARSSD